MASRDEYDNSSVGFREAQEAWDDMVKLMTMDQVRIRESYIESQINARHFARAVAHQRAQQAQQAQQEN